MQQCFHIQLIWSGVFELDPDTSGVTKFINHKESLALHREAEDPRDISSAGFVRQSNDTVVSQKRQETGSSKKANPADFIMHHITDDGESAGSC